MKISIGRFFLIGFLSLSIQSLSAQIQLLFETDQPYSFLVGLDGFVQNPEPVNKIVITGIDTGLHQINFIALGATDTLIYNKQVRLLEKDKQRYLLTIDFSKTPQLQYRGIVEHYPDQALRMKKQKVLEWSTFSEKRFKPKPKTFVVIEASQDLPTLDSNAVAVQHTKPVDSIIEPIDSSVNIIKTETKPTVVIAEKSPLEQILVSIKQQDFEFEKLQMALAFVQKNQYTLEDIQTMASLFRFDDSRLQLALQAQEKLPEGKRKQLGEIFDFEYSRTVYLNSIK
jgi:hypothetical protein